MEIQRPQKLLEKDHIYTWKTRNGEIPLVCTTAAPNFYELAYPVQAEAEKKRRVGIVTLNNSQLIVDGEDIVTTAPVSLRFTKDEALLDLLYGGRF